MYALYKEIMFIQMTDTSSWESVLTSGAVWPLVHVLVPASLSIYVPSIWYLIAIIYLFETLEFLISNIPGFEYWQETTPADSLVSDIVMGLLGYWTIHMLQISRTSAVPSFFAVLCSTNTSPTWYKKWHGVLHVLMSAAATLVGVLSVHAGQKESALEFIYFGLLYVMVTLLFGYNRFVVFALVAVSLISCFAILFEHTVLVCVCVVPVLVLTVVLARCPDSEEETPSKIKTVPELLF